MILWRTSLVVIDARYENWRGHFWNIRHGESLAVPSLLCIWINNYFCLKKSTDSGRSSMADSERGLLEGPNSKELLKFPKSNRISITYALTNNKGETYIDKSCFVFFLKEYVNFVPFSGTFGGMAAFGLLWSVFEGQGSTPPVNASICK